MANEPIDSSPPDVCPSPNRKKWAFFYGGVCVVLGIAALLVWIFILQFRAYTDDAYVQGNQVYITPLRPGFVKAIHTDDTFLVKKGQLLIELDRTDSLIAFEQAQKNLAQRVREVCQMFHQVFAYQAEIELRKAEFIKAAQDYQHRADVLSAEGVSLEDYQHAVAALRAGYFSWQMVKIHYEKALALVQGTSIKSHPLVQATADRFREAWVQLFRCQIYSPVQGLAAQRTIQVGMWVDSGQPLLSVIPLDQIWVNANFKETQLKRMRIGQSVRIISDLYGRNTVFHGRVAGIPGGAGNAFSILPPQNLSGNWIKIVQRLPVRVQLDPQEIEEHPLRVGLSMEVTVNLSDQDGPLVPSSREGSPTYKTSIFEGEEEGNRVAIEEIICGNLDPTLSAYAETPLCLPMLSQDAGVPINESIRKALEMESDNPLSWEAILNRCGDFNKNA